MSTLDLASWLPWTLGGWVAIFLSSQAIATPRVLVSVPLGPMSGPPTLDEALMTAGSDVGWETEGRGRGVASLLILFLGRDLAKNKEREGFKCQHLASNTKRQEAYGAWETDLDLSLSFLVIT